MSYRKGYIKELNYTKRLREVGYEIVASRGSHGSADIWAKKAGSPLALIQVKGGKTKFSGFPPDERLALSVSAKKAGGQAILVWWPDRGKPRVYPESQWPVK